MYELILNLQTMYQKKLYMLTKKGGTIVPPPVLLATFSVVYHSTFDVISLRRPL